MKAATLTATLAAAALLALAPGAASAALPPLSQAEQVQLDHERGREQALLEEQKRALAQAQRRVVQHYVRDMATRGIVVRPQEVSDPIPDSAIPKEARVPVAEAGPHGGREQSAESHSAPAR